MQCFAFSTFAPESLQIFSTIFSTIILSLFYIIIQTSSNSILYRYSLQVSSQSIYTDIILSSYQPQSPGAPASDRVHGQASSLEPETQTILIYMSMIIDGDGQLDSSCTMKVGKCLVLCGWYII